MVTVEYILLERRMYLKKLVILCVLFLSANSQAQINEVDIIRASIMTLLPDVEVNNIEKSALPGMYSVLIGAEVLYITADGKYLFKGDLIDIPNKSNVSEDRRSIARKAILKNIPKSEYISYSPKNPKHKIFVFTDITCGFCQKLQSEITQINEKGIEVNYLAFPREGLNTITSFRMESVWCANDRQSAFLDAMKGEDIAPTDCNNPVAEHYGLGQSMGVRGTPAIYTEDGRYLPGYMPPDDLLKAVSNN